MKTKILENLTKLGGVKTSFLKENNTNEKECYDIVNGSKKCNLCENKASFISFNKGYKDTCSETKCKKQSKKEKTEKTCLEKYGVYNISQLKEIKERKVKSSIKTCLEKYGVENPFQVKEFTHDINGNYKAHSKESKEKRNTTLLEKYGTSDPLSINNGRERGLQKCNYDPAIKEKRKETCIERYGAENTFSSKEFQESLKDIIEEKYGVRNISYLQETKDKISEKLSIICTTEEMVCRRYKVDQDGKTSIQKQKETNILNGIWVADEEKTDLDIYRRNVWKVTNKQDLSTLENIERRGHINFDSDAYHLNHKFSIIEGFKQNIPVFIIGNICNLEMVHNKVNSMKREKCSIDINTLLEKYYGEE